MRGFIVSLLFFLSLPAQAEVLTWDCNFNKRVASDGITDEKMHLIFKVDTLSRKSVMQGNAGLVDVNIHIGDEAFSFTEAVASGTVQTTTITRDGEAVHSRNTVILGEIVAAQHFGTCLFE